MGIFLRRGGGRGGLPNSYNHLSLHSLFENSEKCNVGKIPIKSCFLRGVPPDVILVSTCTTDNDTVRGGTEEF